MRIAGETKLTSMAAIYPSVLSSAKWVLLRNCFSFLNYRLPSSHDHILLSGASRLQLSLSLVRPQPAGGSQGHRHPRGQYPTSPLISLAVRGEIHRVLHILSLGGKPQPLQPALGLRALLRVGTPLSSPKGRPDLAHQPKK